MPCRQYDDSFECGRTERDFVGAVGVGSDGLRQSDLGLWLLIGKSRCRVSAFDRLSDFNLGNPFLCSVTPELGNFVCVFFVCDLSAWVFGAFGLEKEYRRALASQNRQ
jgi:hypothetical protein